MPSHEHLTLVPRGLSAFLAVLAVHVRRGGFEKDKRMSYERYARQAPPEPDHAWLQHASLTWLRSRSWQLRWCSEATIASDCRVDALAIHRPTREFRKRLGLPESISDVVSVVFEAKVSRADFFCTFGSMAVRPRTTVANFHWIITPRKLVRPDECPDPWGLLEAVGVRGLRIVKIPLLCEISRVQHLELAEIILWHREPWWRKQEADKIELQEESESSDATV
ncbi:hypothetical protein M0R72_10740 [Candidatus Pacearchaeota archaeon]|jgi:hypothetical protein|nr:hypothetical protein [Candidatus Pacearchaeota archaeon]